MKKIIAGKKYDTETAKEVGYWSNNYSYSDFSYCEEKLFRKRNGEYFLYGSGGAMTIYAECCCDGRCGGSNIIPMTVDEAKQWAEEHIDVDEYEAEFGEVEE